MICEVCGKERGCQKHHKFPQHKWARRLYGALLDHPKNIMMVGPDCHASHAKMSGHVWTEKEFCEALGIEPRSKTERIRYERDKIQGVGCYKKDL